MTKEWACADCGEYETRGLVASLRGPPEECENCGGTEFEAPIVHGSVHAAIDRLVG